MSNFEVDGLQQLRTSSGSTPVSHECEVGVKQLNINNNKKRAMFSYIKLSDQFKLLLSFSSYISH